MGPESMIFLVKVMRFSTLKNIPSRTLSFSTKPRVDMRSDTLTKPTEGMFRAMLAAPLGDDVFKEDPTVNLLEETIAARFNKESALFFPTGTMSNLAAILSHCNNRGSELISGSNTHITLYEGGGCATLGGVHNRQIVEGEDGSLDIDTIASFIRSDDVHEPRSRLVCLENTHNYKGGRVLPIEYIDKVGHFCEANDLKLHIDGARIYNAMVASGYGVDALCGNADSVSVCLSKGLGAPMGSVLVGDSELIYLARRARKTLGGGMRQAGVVAAAGLYAINDEEGHVKRLALDHQLAAELSVRLKKAGYEIPHQVETNIIYFAPPPSARLGALEFSEWMKSQFNVHVGSGYSGGKLMRAVVHRDLTEGDVKAAATAFEDALLKL